MLLKMLPGASLPQHHHDGVEQCYVLEGDFRVGGETYGAGDFQCALPGSTHQPIHTVGGALVLIVAPAVGH